MAESSIEKAFARWCKANDLWTMKLKLSSGAGWPDRAVLLPDNRVCWLEFKTSDGDTDPVQDFVIREMAKFGHQVFIPRSCSEAQNAIARLSKSRSSIHP